MTLYQQTEQLIRTIKIFSQQDREISHRALTQQAGELLMLHGPALPWWCEYVLRSHLMRAAPYSYRKSPCQGLGRDQGLAVDSGFLRVIREGVLCPVTP